MTGIGPPRPPYELDERGYKLRFQWLRDGCERGDWSPYWVLISMGRLPLRSCLAYIWPRWLGWLDRQAVAYSVYDSHYQERKRKETREL